MVVVDMVLEHGRKRREEARENGEKGDWMTEKGDRRGEKGEEGDRVGRWEKKPPFHHSSES